MSIDLEIKVSYKKLIFFTIIFFIIFVCLSVFFIITPNITAIKESSNQMTRERTELEESLKKIKNPANLQDDLERLDLRIVSAEESLMKKGDELELIKILEDTALKNHIAQSIFPENSEEDSSFPFAKMSLKLNLSGSFKNILDYIQDIETLKYYININSITLSKSQTVSKFQSLDNPDINQTENVSCLILAETYWK